MKYPHLPETEFAIMDFIWKTPQPISGKHITDSIQPTKGWKAQTIHSLLSRLEDKGFITSEKVGRERFFRFVIEREAYLNQETEHFIKSFHHSSLTGLMSSLFSSKTINDEDIHELESWLEAHKGGRDDT